MKKSAIASAALAIIMITGACHPKAKPVQEQQAAVDTTASTDTGFTGIKKMMSGRYLVKEVTFKNGVKEGITKTFYVSGALRQTLIYRNGLRADSAVWHYVEGQKFRVTPYVNDTVEGIQRQYYRTGELKAKIGYSKGMRTTFFQEFSKNGKLVGGYPDLITTITDNYKTGGTYKISLSLSDKSPDVRFWKGDIINNRFDTLQCKKLKVEKGICNIVLKKGASASASKIGIIAEILTGFGNNYLVYKKIELPYNDLR